MFNYVVVKSNGWVAPNFILSRSAVTHTVGTNETVELNYLVVYEQLLETPH